MAHNFLPSLLVTGHVELSLNKNVLGSDFDIGIVGNDELADNVETLSEGEMGVEQRLVGGGIEDDAFSAGNLDFFIQISAIEVCAPIDTRGTMEVGVARRFDEVTVLMLHGPHRFHRLHERSTGTIILGEIILRMERINIPLIIKETHLRSIIIAIHAIFRNVFR